MKLYLVSAVLVNLALCSACFAQNPIPLPPGQHQLFLDNRVVGDSAGLVSVMHRPVKKGAVIRPDIPSDGPLIQTRMEPVWSAEDGLYRLLYYAYGGGSAGTGMALATSKDGLVWEKPILGLVEVNGSKENNWIPLDAFPKPNNAIDGMVCDPDDPNPERRFKALIGAINRRPATSPDAIHWTPLGTEVIASSDESHLGYDPEKRMYMAMCKTSNEYGRAFAIATSTDFEHWTPNRALFGADAEDQPMALEVIRARVANPNMMGLLFVEPDPATGAPKGKIPTWRAEVYNIGVFAYEGLYIGLPSMYYPTGLTLPEANNTDGFHVIQLAMTRDLTTWTRLGGRKPFIETSGVENGRIGVYDRVQILAANRPIVTDEELRIYYTALKWRDDFYGRNKDGSPRDPATLSDEDKADIKDGWGAICMAVLRRDGFVSLRADGEGVFTTPPLLPQGGQLYVNADASKGGIRVEVLGDTDSALPGYTVADSRLVAGDGVRQAVTWTAMNSLPKLVRFSDGKVGCYNEGMDLSAAAQPGGVPIRLRFHVTKADLYSFWVE